MLIAWVVAVPVALVIGVVLGIFKFYIFISAILVVSIINGLAMIPWDNPRVMSVQYFVRGLGVGALTLVLLFVGGLVSIMFKKFINLVN
jgi:hypothetical protein